MTDTTASVATRPHLVGVSAGPVGPRHDMAPGDPVAGRVGVASIRPTAVTTPRTAVGPFQGSCPFGTTDPRTQRLAPAAYLTSDATGVVITDATRGGVDVGDPHQIRALRRSPPG